MANGSQESEQWQGFVKEIKTNFDKSNEQLKSTVISQSKTQNVTINEIKASNAKIEASVSALQVRQDMSIAEIKTSDVESKESIAEIKTSLVAQ